MTWYRVLLIGIPSLPLVVSELTLFVCFQNGAGISAKCRDAQVEDLWGLSSFFGYSTQTFVLAVNLLDRFLALMRVRLPRPDPMSQAVACTPFQDTEVSKGWEKPPLEPTHVFINHRPYVCTFGSSLK